MSWLINCIRYRENIVYISFRAKLLLVAESSSFRKTPLRLGGVIYTFMQILADDVWSLIAAFILPDQSSNVTKYCSSSGCLITFYNHLCSVQKRTCEMWRDFLVLYTHTHVCTLQTSLLLTWLCTDIGLKCITEEHNTSHGNCFCFISTFGADRH